MTNIAILGFGVVGKGVADLIMTNQPEIIGFGGDEVNIKYILDLRDFPDSPLADRVVHDFNIILSDEEVSVVIEVMGGSHPAYEFTSSAIKAGKSVVTSNKEVVANFGDELLRLAKDHGVSYRFEASVCGGIPVISPMINCIGQNKINEVRGILNGTTNYILTKMFSFGDSFECALKDAQEKGYAERNPDADILGLDAARKISILSAIATGKLISTEKIHTEGITGIRKADVLAADKLGMSIKLIGRCVKTDDSLHIMVAPFMVGGLASFSAVNGVYNAVEIIGDPLGNVMFYGKGAGGGATSSAVVGDLMQIMRLGANAIAPVFERSESISDFSTFTSKHYLALDGDPQAVKSIIPDAQFIESDECALVTEKMTESEIESRISSLLAIGITTLSHIRLL